MTKIKLCGLKRPCDIDYANAVMPDFAGFVFAPKSKRYVTPEAARDLREKLNAEITPVGVFVNEPIGNIEYLVERNIISMVQLHGTEDNEYIELLRKSVRCPIIQAFCIKTKSDAQRAEQSEADYIMLDSGGGTGETFEHSLIGGVSREFFLAGGLDCKNVRAAISKYRPFAVDASSSLETDGVKDKEKMKAFVEAVRKGR